MYQQNQHHHRQCFLRVLFEHSHPIMALSGHLYRLILLLWTSRIQGFVPGVNTRPPIGRFLPVSFHAELSCLDASITRETEALTESPKTSSRALEPTASPRYIPLPNTDGSFTMANVPGFCAADDRTFGERYAELHEYCQNHGHARVPQTHPSGLGIWVTIQRYLWNRLTTAQQDELHQAGLLVRVHKSWEERYTDLQAYHQAFGHARVPLDEIGGLGQWVKRQRDLQAQGNLSKERMQRLEELQVVWKTKRDKNARWNVRYQELVEFRKRYGHVLGPRQEGPLSLWIQTQRTQYRQWCQGDPTHMTAERIRLLNDIDFVWDHFAYIWQCRYQELVDFVEQHGHTLVPTCKTDPLWLWVQVQRAEYRKYQRGETSQMTQERMDLLNQIGFVWNVLDYQWQVRYAQLVRYQAKHGDTLVPQKQRNGLGRWVSRQRFHYHKYLDGDASSHMTPERIAQLERIGFVWDAMHATSTIKE